MIYLSGIPQLRSNITAVIEFYNDSISVGPLFGKEVVIPKDQLISVQEKTEEQISKDVTLTRLLALGIFAFALKKKRRSSEKYLILSYMDSGQQIYAVFKGHAQKVFRQLFEAIREGQEMKSLRAQPPMSGSDSPTLNKLAQLNELRVAGAISEDEYNRLKANILSNLF